MSKPCRYFSSPGGCHRGNLCTFRHDQEQSSSNAPQTPTVLCRFLNSPGGCRKGDTCTFRHDQDLSSSNPGSPNHLSSRDPDTAPLGACRSFWNTGECKHSFNCRYKHKENPLRRSTEQQRPSELPSASSMNTGNPDFLFAGEKTPDSPAVTHNYLMKFLRDEFRFMNKAHDAGTFLRLLNNATASVAPKSSSLWTAEEGQQLFFKIASGNGLLRLADVVRWPNVSSRAGANRLVLSFQNHYVLLLRFFASDIVVKSSRSNLVNGTYMVVMENLEMFTTTVEKCMSAIMVEKRFRDPFERRAPGVPASGSCYEVISYLSTILYECITRFKNAVVTYPNLLRLVRAVHDWFTTWSQAVNSPDPQMRFDDPCTQLDARQLDYLISQLKERVDRNAKISTREESKIDMAKNASSSHIMSQPSSAHEEGVIAALHMVQQSVGGRHDNDHADIGEIRIAPTSQELICELPQFIPANIYDAPHHLPVGTMDRELDIQFRLLREELIAPLRASVQNVRNDLLSMRQRRTRMHEIFSKQGGKYRGFNNSQDSVIFNVYTGVSFSYLVPDWRGLATLLTIDTPPGRARSQGSGARTAYWESMGGKRLMQGCLVALIWEEGNDVDVYLGTMTSSTKDLKDSAASSASRLELKVVFFDDSVQMRVLQSLRQHSGGGRKVLIEAPVMFEAIRPFLEALRREPESIPFGKYLIHQPARALALQGVDPPQYATAPGFSFQLESLFREEAGVTGLELSVTDPDSVEVARRELKERSRLDPSQADAVVDALTREVSLIQGPPGTGKSYTGVEIIRILRQVATPILLIAFTNHALDHLLNSVIDNNITRRIVRLGGRSADERMREFSIEALEMAQGGSSLDGTIKDLYRNLKDTQKQIKQLMEKVVRKTTPSGAIMRHLDIEFPEHWESISYPPNWVSEMISYHIEQAGEGWERVQRRGKAPDNQNDEGENINLKFWLDGEDLDYLEQQSLPVPEAEAEIVDDVQLSSRNRFDVLAQVEGEQSGGSERDDISEVDIGDIVEEDWQTGSWDVVLVEDEDEPTVLLEDIQRLALQDPASQTPTSAILEILESSHSTLPKPDLPEVPRTNRPLQELLENSNVWFMSKEERRGLFSHWERETRDLLEITQHSDFDRLRDLHQEQLRSYQECKDQLSSLMKSLSPQVMVVEEAGQVLEAHILGTLVPSIEHMILIGDPLQLRPTLNNYALSMDNKRGKELYKFDMSLMERLSSGGLPMSLIDVQRRMRPDIADLVRNTLYPRLDDHNLVKKYPDVRGFRKNIFFMTHNHPENDGSEDISSKYNTFEANMIKELVLYLVRQGYSNDGDIVVLVGYLGQLVRVREVLSEQVTVVIDERDQRELENTQLDDDSEDTAMFGSVRTKKISSYVRIRTIDNYQGEEAKVVATFLPRMGRCRCTNTHDVRLSFCLPSGMLVPVMMSLISVE
ncbi:hypothetical protein D9758_014721 [Tetrapyrgos nigripes]|uniref:C3H1-type domain-containing protein n=1 Tax=Tetrapyrgos nigripes TaxID=182062 RepID=A0A8H5CCU1_9AGAR|nr:hypothetical protein D9758_014721 [Tetrapyrgos nigripes]